MTAVFLPPKAASIRWRDLIRMGMADDPYWQRVRQRQLRFVERYLPVNLLMALFTLGVLGFSFEGRIDPLVLGFWLLAQAMNLLATLQVWNRDRLGRPRRLSGLRPMREDDLDAVHAIEIRAYEFPWTPGIFRDCLRADYPSWVLTESGRLIGYFLMSVAAGEAHVLNVCVAPEAHGRGHGRRLLRALLHIARGRGADDAGPRHGGRRAGGNAGATGRGRQAVRRGAHRIRCDATPLGDGVRTRSGLCARAGRRWRRRIGTRRRSSSPPPP